MASAVVAPLIAGLFPRKLVPGVVLLLLAGIIIGPHVLDIAGSENPGLLVAFVLLILLVRSGPVFISARFDRGSNGTDPSFTVRERTQLALYAGTGLPVIVAVAGVAVGAGTMTTAHASALVAAGAITVLLFPLRASPIGSAGNRLLNLESDAVESHSANKEKPRS
ncbi:hypothetical protein [Rhodococcus xishaensis]|uniref:hypothetical protein n=1 Tax=Rhodococcus xishaensis TaxID=2487364 RepID=UPI001F2967F4|nr:hypothetical protein [Rhodococcus xishaensis]